MLIQHQLDRVSLRELVRQTRPWGHFGQFLHDTHDNILQLRQLRYHQSFDHLKHKIHCFQLKNMVVAHWPIMINVIGS